MENRSGDVVEIRVLTADDVEAWSRLRLEGLENDPEASAPKSI